MEKVLNLKQERAEKFSLVEKLIETAKKADRDFTDEETAKFTELESDIANLDKSIERAEKRELMEKRIAEQKAQDKRVKTPETEVSRHFSISGAIKNLVENRGVPTGVYKEAHQEAEKEAREAGVTLSGMGVPSVLHPRAMSDGTTTAGGHTVATNVNPIIPVLRPKLLAESMGATTMFGLKGNVDIPRVTAGGSATWEGEADAAAETTDVFDKISLTPNRLAAYTIFSKQLLYQSEEAIEQFVKDDLEMAIKIAVDSAMINGSGSGQPKGILNWSGIGDVAGGTNGLAPTWGNLVDLEKEVDIDNALMESLAYLTTPGIKGYLKKTLADAGSGQYIWDRGETTLNGYKVGISTQVPSDLDKGSSTGVCNAIIFGNFKDLLLGSWGPAFDLVIDPYSLVRNAQIQVVVNSFWDVQLRHVESFAAMQDALLS